ncbi:hypothetical protein [Microbispora hainanensis]|uniref:Uncharacterized protein n=1 Tax=Microbispora hainanensis TaxID=568844 RepID=A0ABZ1SPM7_9ACTN|nr:hypothetical protein [Microbispora hainanensis]
MNAFPVESQQRLLAEHGFAHWFGGQWVSIDDGKEVARRLHVEAETIVTCDLRTAVRSYSPASEARRIWISPLAAGWSHILGLGGSMPSAEMLSTGGRRVFEIHFFGETGEVEPPFYAFDGTGSVDFFSEEEYSAHWEDLEYDGTLSPAEELEQYLIIMGRIAGRFLDRAWVSSQGLLCTIP